MKDWYLEPLVDPENIDPDNGHIQKLVNRFEEIDPMVGAVCEVYELCGHLLCAKSYELWCALDVTKKALAGEEIAQ